MAKCSCYHAVDNWLGLPGVCWGTKEREPCRCGGDERKCDFYPEKRKGEVDMKEIDDAYKRGAEDAWKAAKKIVLPGFLGGYSIDELIEIFETSSFSDIFKDIGCLEAIEKIQRYEKRNEFQVGDEVTNGTDTGVVTKIGNTDFALIVLLPDGVVEIYDPKDWTKTGRRFPQIAEVLKAMDEAMGK